VALTLSLSVEERGALMAPLAETDRRALEQLVRYGPAVAGGVAEPRVACVHEDASVARALETLHGDAQAAHYYVYVVARGHKLSGVASLRSLLLAEPAARVVDVMAARPEHIPAAATLSTLAAHPGWSRFSALPVVAPSGELVGVIRYARYREIVESLGQGGRAPDQTASTVAALAEVYSVGTSALVSWVGSSLTREGSDGK
jgi:magnesium transporter